MKFELIILRGVLSRNRVDPITKREKMQEARIWNAFVHGNQISVDKILDLIYILNTV